MLFMASTMQARRNKNYASAMSLPDSCSRRVSVREDASCDSVFWLPYSPPFRDKALLLPNTTTKQTSL